MTTSRYTIRINGVAFGVFNSATSAVVKAELLGLDDYEFDQLGPNETHKPLMKTIASFTEARDEHKTER